MHRKLAMVAFPAHALQVAWLVLLSLGFACTGAKHRGPEPTDGGDHGNLDAGVELDGSPGPDASFAAHDGSVQPNGRDAATFFALEASWADELIELFPGDSEPRVAEGDRFEFDAARGTLAAAHILVRGLSVGDSLSMSVRREGEPLSDAAWYNMVDVAVAANSGLFAQTDPLSNPQNLHVIRRAPFRIYEALAPVSSPVSVASEELVLRIELPIAADATPGDVSYQLRLVSGDKARDMVLTVHVFGAVVPPLSESTLDYTNWFNLDNIASRHGLELWSEPYMEMLEKYARLMAKGRQNTFWLDLPAFTYWDDDGLLVPNVELIESYVALFSRAGLTKIEMGTLVDRENNDWGLPNLVLGVETSIYATSDRGTELLTHLGEQLMALIEKNHWQDRWFQHVSDEPGDLQADAYNHVAKIVHDTMPGIPVLDALSAMESVQASVDVWCPGNDQFQAHPEFYAQVQADGDELWVYTSQSPGGPYMNRLIDQERVRQVYFGWAALLYDLHGYLHWGLNQYQVDDPFEETTLGDALALEAGHGNPPGDTHIVYPGPDGPWSSQRFEAHRIGMEDHELLKQLDARDPTLTRQLVGQLVRSFSDYEKSVAAYRKTRRALLEALDESP